MLKAGIPIVVIDGMGVWWGLRVSADGKSPGLPIVVFGGEHPDLPLIPEKAAEMARAIVESNISCVLDLSGLSKRLSHKIVTDFLNELYKLNRAIRHVYIEEADLWAPQRPMSPEADLCLSAVDNFVRRGGNHNLGCTLITQRSAVLNKNILTQSDCLVILRTLAPQDKKAIQAWVEEQTDKDKTSLEEWYDSLKSLKDGEAWVWHPEPPSIYQRVMYRQRETFHATRKFLLSPQASRITLMGVGEFVERFKKVFDMSEVLTHSAGSNPARRVLIQPGVNPALLKELEEYRSGHKLAESVQQRLKFLSDVKTDLQKRIDEQAEELKLYDELKSVLRRMFPKGIPAAFDRPLSDGDVHSGTVGLQKVTKVLSVEETHVIVPTIRTDTVKGKVLQLAKEDFFKGWRNLSEVNKQLSDRAWTCASSAVSQALSDLVDESILGARKTDRNEYKLAPDVVFEGKKEIA